MLVTQMSTTTSCALSDPPVHGLCLVTQIRTVYLIPARSHEYAIAFNIAVTHERIDASSVHVASLDDL